MKRKQSVRKKHIIRVGLYKEKKKPVLRLVSYLKATKDMNEYKKLCEIATQRNMSDEVNPYA